MPSPQDAPSKRDLKRDKLIQAVIQSIAKNGWEETTLERIGLRFKMTRAHVAYYFEGRDEMLFAATRLVTKTAQQLTIQRVQNATGWEEQLQAVVDGALDWLEKHREHAAVFLLSYHLAAISRPYRKLHTEIRNAGSVRIQQILENSELSLSDSQLVKLSKRIQNQITGAIVDAVVTEFTQPFSVFREELASSVLSLAREEQFRGSAS